MTTCSLTHRVVINILEILFGRITHGAGRIIHCPRHHADIRHCHIILHHILLYRTPFHLFHAEYRLVIDNIRIRTVQSCRLVEAMQIQRQFIFGSHLGNAVSHFNRSLVIPVEEVYFKSADTHFGIFLAGFFQLVIQHVEHRPENQVNPFAFTITDQFLQIQFRYHSQHVSFTRIIPAFIQYDKLDVIVRCKVNIIFVGFHIDARLEVNIIDSPIVPPIPSYLTGLYPRSISDTVGRSQSIYQIIHRHFRILLRYCPNAPRITPLSIRFGNITGTLHHPLHGARRKLLHPGRILGKGPLQGGSFTIPFDKHAGIIFQVRLQ